MRTYDKTISISDTRQIGLPFSQTFYKPTPKFWRILGDSLMTGSGIITIVGTVTALNPVIIAVGAIALLAGKLITNCVSEK